MGRTSFVLKDSRDLYISLLLILILGIAVFLVSYIYDIDREIKEFEISDSKETINIEKEIRSKGELYTKAPLGKNYKSDSSQAYIFSILSYDKSWNLHRVLENLLQSNRMFFVVVGIIYSNNKFYSNKYKNYKKQIINMNIFNILGICLTIGIGYIILLKVDQNKMVHTDLFSYISGIYDNYNIWKPGFVYNIFSILFILLTLFSYSSIGYLIGNLTGKIIMSILVYVLLSPILYLYPVSPIYFLRKLRKFVFVATNTFLYKNGGSFIDLIYLLIFIILYYFLSYIIVEKRK